MKIAKLLLSGIIASGMFLTGVSVFANTQKTVKVTIGSNIANVNGQSVTMNAVPYIQEYTNVTMIPLRFVATALGIPDSDIIYDAEAKRVTINTNKRFNESDAVIYFLNWSIGNYGYAELKNSTTYIPLRALCNDLDLSLEWDSNTKTATMTVDNSLANNTTTNSTQSTTSQTQTTTNTSTSTTLTEQEIRAMEEEVVRLVNEERAKYGLEPLQIDETLMQGARLKSEDMLQNNYYSHTSPTYGSATNMMENVFNYKFNGYYAGVGENIGGNCLTAKSVVIAWLSSSGHRANILNENYKYIGVGYSNGYWTQIFYG